MDGGASVPDSTFGFVHVFEPPADASAPIFLLLHGTGGDERDLLSFGRALDSRAGALSPRGKVLEQGMPRFFRRLAEGVFDLEDLHRRTDELAAFVAGAADAYRFTLQRLIAVGFSNGANIAASLLLSCPGLLGRAALFRAMVPFVPDSLPSLAHTPVLVSNGRTDPFVALGETERLATLLSNSGADVTLAWQHAGHSLTPADVESARRWLTQVLVPG